MSTLLHVRSLFVILLLLLTVQAHAQIGTFPFHENFDRSSSLPEGWSAAGFSFSTTSARSAPSCISATGNQSTKFLESPSFDLRSHRLVSITYWERRSSTALPFRLALLAVTDTGVITIARFDTSTSTSAYVQRFVTLEGYGLDQYDSIRFRWMLLGDNTSSSGVLRIDDITVTAASMFGVSIREIVVRPGAPVRRDAIEASATIVNSGLTSVAGWSTEWFLSSDPEHLFRTPFRMDRHPVALAPGDSFVQTLTLGALSPGIHWIGLRCRLENDTTAWDTLSRSLRVGYALRDLVVTEFMYAPLNDEPEWIEISNPGPHAIDLNGWTVSDNSAKTRALLTDRMTQIHPNSYVILARDAALAAQYALDSSVPVLVVPFPSLNNTTPDAVVLRDPSERPIDSVSYDPTRFPQTGRSLERIDFEKEGTDTTNWSPPTDSLRATPGRMNSVARMDRDLAVRSIAFDRSFMTIHVVVSNPGRDTASGFRLDISLSRSGNFERLLPEYLATAPLLPGDSTIVVFAADSLSPGRTTIWAVIEDAGDERWSNNTLSLTVDSRHSRGCLIISEIMYDPAEGSCEWVELQNASGERISLDDWTITDAPTASGGMNSTPLSGSLGAGERIVIAADSTFFRAFPSADRSMIVVRGSTGLGLNNDADAIVLHDATASVIDSVWFTEDLHHPDVALTRGRSLERIHPQISSTDARNWSTSVDPSGGTPGRPNSISVRTTQASHGTVVALPNPFSPDGDGYEDHTLLQFALEAPSSFITIRIFDLRGHLVRTLTHLELVGPTGAIVWDGRDDRRRPLSPGGYIVLFEASHSSTERPHVMKLLVAVARRM